MKRNLLFLFIAAVILFAIWILRPRHNQPQSISLQTNEIQLQSPAAKANVVSASPTSTPKLTHPLEGSNYVFWLEKEQKEAGERALNQWKTPIEFYGRVIDESNNVISGAKVDYSCNDTSSTGTSYYHTQSDANGSFSFNGIQGKLLEVDVNKEGYYPYDPHGQFFYYAGQNHNFIPDAGNPVVFRLRKKGEGADLIKVDYPGFAHIAQLKHDGTPVELDLFQGKQVAVGSGQLKLELQRNLSDKNAKIYNWNLQMTMSGGGFAGTDEEFPFTAPETGYQSQIIFDMSTNNPDWQGRVNTNYYFQLSDGKYGRMSFEFLSWNGVFTIHAFINPSGSQNLEPK